MADTKVLAIADDESRVGGKERLMLCAMSEQGIACWAPPQAGLGDELVSRVHQSKNRSASSD